MEKNTFVTAISIAVIIIAFSSSLNTGTSALTVENVFLESYIVEFAYVGLEKQIDEKGVVKVTVKWLFHNIAGRTINATINAEFYNRNDVLLYNASKEIWLLPANYTEQLLLPANMISFYGQNAAEVEYVIIHVNELQDSSN